MQSFVMNWFRGGKNKNKNLLKIMGQKEKKPFLVKSVYLLARKIYNPSNISTN